VKITKDSVVTFHYRLTTGESEFIEDSSDGEPLVYLHGYNHLIVGMEKALQGKKKDDQFSVTIAIEDGYGEKLDGLIQVVPRSSFEGIEDVYVGMRFQASTEQGEVPVIVVAITEDTITVDGNHPLAGKPLDFTVDIKDVRAASKEEIEHGHVHGKGGHQH